jgi:hypothetical protein
VCLSYNFSAKHVSPRAAMAVRTETQVRRYCHILTDIGTCRQVLALIPTIVFNENPFSSPRDECGETDRPTFRSQYTDFRVFLL